MCFFWFKSFFHDFSEPPVCPTTWWHQEAFNIFKVKIICLEQIKQFTVFSSRSRISISFSLEFLLGSSSEEHSVSSKFFKISVQRNSKIQKQAIWKKCQQKDLKKSTLLCRFSGQKHLVNGEPVMRRVSLPLNFFNFKSGSRVCHPNQSDFVWRNFGANRR